MSNFEQLREKLNRQRRKPDEMSFGDLRVEFIFKNTWGCRKDYVAFANWSIFFESGQMAFATGFFFSQCLLLFFSENKYFLLFRHLRKLLDSIYGDSEEVKYKLHYPISVVMRNGKSMIFQVKRDIFVTHFFVFFFLGKKDFDLVLSSDEAQQMRDNLSDYVIHELE